MKLTLEALIEVEISEEDLREKWPEYFNYDIEEDGYEEGCAQIAESDLIQLMVDKGLDIDPVNSMEGAQLHSVEFHSIED
jgi:hypothetical protein